MTFAKQVHSYDRGCCVVRNSRAEPDRWVVFYKSTIVGVFAPYEGGTTTPLARAFAWADEITSNRDAGKLLCAACGGTILAPTRGGVPRGTCRCQRQEVSYASPDAS